MSHVVRHAEEIFLSKGLPIPERQFKEGGTVYAPLRFQFLFRRLRPDSGLGCRGRMKAGKSERGYPNGGGRPPPKRTYGSKQGSKLGGLQRDAQQQQHSAETSLFVGADGARNNNSSTALALTTQKPGRPELANGLLLSADCYRSLQLAQRKSGGGSFRSKADEISHLVRVTGAGGEEGRASAIALAKACKSTESRKVMLTTANGNGSTLLENLMSVMLAALQGCRRQRDEAIVYCLAVTLFTLSKDRALAKGFTASDVSTLAVLIGGTQGASTEKEEVIFRSSYLDGVGGGGGGGADDVGLLGVLLPDSAASTKVAAVWARRREILETPESLEPVAASASPPGERCDGVAPRARVGASLFDMTDEDEDDTVGGGGGSLGGVGVVGVGGNGREKADVVSKYCDSSSSRDTNSVGVASALSLPYSTAKDHGSAEVLVRARMLLDISDMIPWGMANRHLVSAADLGLATLLNVAAQACPEGGEKGDVGKDSARDSLEDDFSTQNSTASQSESTGVMGDFTGGLADGDMVATRNARVMSELSRLGPSGFLSPIVVGGVAFLDGLSPPRAGQGGAAASADPSSLRAVHQLLLGLRLLDLATLEKSGDWTDAAETSSADTAVRPLQSAGLIDAVLLLVSRCQSLIGDAGRVRPRRGSPDREAKRGGLGQGHQRSTIDRFGDEVLSRVHECLLAALRVLINVTHHNRRVCAEVAARGGLNTLISCLVAHSECQSRPRDSDESSHLARRDREDSVAALLGDVANVGGEDMQDGAALDDANDGASRGDRAGRAGGGGGDFDVQILAMGALINCVELKESAANCASMASLVVRPSSATGLKAAGGVPERKVYCVGLSSRCFAPEFLARLLIHCTKGFAQQLEADKSNQGEEGPASPPPRATEGGGVVIRRRDSTESCASGVAPAVEPMTPDAMMLGEDGGEEVMSHAEGADLVLGGHCALLLGLLVRAHEKNRRLVLSVLPDGAPTLIVRTLEAFMALQWQAGVLTEEVVLAVQGLVEELEGIEGLPEEEWNPFELEAEDDPPTPGLPTTATPPRKGRKRPRSPTNTPLLRTFTTPESGKWDMDAEGDSDADGFTLSLNHRRPTARGEERTLSWRQSQACDKRSPGPSGGGATATSKPSPCSNAPSPDLATRPVARCPADGSSDAEAKPSLWSHTPLSARMPWRVGSTAGTRLGRGIGGGSAAGTRSWLDGSRPRTYGRQSWKKPSPSLAGLDSSSVYGNMGNSGRARGKALASGSSDRYVGDILSDNSEDLLQHPKKPGSRSGGGGGGGEGGGGLGPKSGRRSKSIFDLNDWSDSSSESAKMPDSNAGRTATVAPRVARVATTAHPIRKSALESGGFDGGSSASQESSVAGFTAQSKANGRQRRARSRSPVARTEEAMSVQGRVGPLSSGVGKGSSTTPIAPTPSGPKPGKGATDVARRGRSPSRSRTGTAERAVNDWKSGSRPPRPPQPAEAIGRQVVRGAGRPLLSEKEAGGGAHGRAGGSKPEKKKLRSVFELDDSDSQDAWDANVCELDDESD